MSEIKSFNLWIEGYACTGDSSPAHFLGTFEAVSFSEACDKWVETLSENGKKYYNRNGGIACFWGCRIYDNETDARKSFG